MAKKMITPGHDLLQRVTQAFLDHGYSGLTMVGLARACGFTQRALYYYFSNKEEAFRAAVKFRNDRAIETALASGRELRAKDASALDVLSHIIDVRYGETWRSLSLSPHTLELTAESFRRCRDLLDQSATNFRNALETLIIDMQQHDELRLTGRFSAGEIAQTLADAGRAVNQSLPAIPADGIAGRYRKTCEMALYGCATPQA